MSNAVLTDTTRDDFLENGSDAIHLLNDGLCIPVNPDDGQADDLVTVAEGSVMLTEDYHMQGAQALFIDGDLTIDGGFFTRMGYHPQNFQQVVINGNLTVKRAFMGVDVTVAGDVTIEEALITHSWGDFSLTVGGDFNVPLLLDGGHHFVVTGSNNTQRINGYDDEGMPALGLADEFMDDGRLNFWAAIDHLKAGKRLK